MGRKFKNPITRILIHYSPQGDQTFWFPVAEGRLELLTYGFARQCSNQLSYSDTWSVQVFEFL